MFSFPAFIATCFIVRSFLKIILLYQFCGLKIHSGYSPAPVPTTPALPLLPSPFLCLFKHLETLYFYEDSSDCDDLGVGEHRCSGLKRDLSSLTENGTHTAMEKSTQS